MPEGLEKGLSPQDLANLIAYLRLNSVKRRDGASSRCRAVNFGAAWQTA